MISPDRPPHRAVSAGRQVRYNADVVHGSSWLLGLALLAAACSVGDGVGEAKGAIDAPACGLSGAFDLDPDFFGAEFFEHGLTITLQRGGDYQVDSDGMLIDVPDIAEVNRHLGSSLPVRYEPDANLAALDEAVRVSLYLNETCSDDEEVGLVGVRGQVSFVTIGDGRIDEADPIEGSFSVDFAEPSGRGATGHLEGFFRFRYTRGRPAQRFP